MWPRVTPGTLALYYIIEENLNNICGQTLPGVAPPILYGYLQLLFGLIAHEMLRMVYDEL